MSWAQEKIGNLCTVGRGSSPRPIADQKYFDGGTIPWVKIADATASTRYIYKTKQCVNDYGASFSRKLSPGSIILAASGTLGFPMYLGVEACIHDGWLYFDEFNSKKIDKGFFFYKLETLRPYFEQLSYGAAIQNVNTGILRNTVIEIPSLEIQRKIARIISAYDDLIENNSKRIVLLEEMAQITYEEWFVRLRFPDHESTSINPETSLPEGWSKTKLKAVLTLNYGKALKADTRTEGDIPVYGSSGIVGTHNEALVKGCGIIVGRKGNVGSVFWSHDSFYPIDTVYFVTSKHTLPFLYFALKNSKFNNSDAAVPGLNRDAAYAVEIMLPTEAVEKQFSLMAQKNFQAIQLLEMKNQRLREARDILLPRLMTGVIDVESYDPAGLLKEAA